MHRHGPTSVRRLAAAGVIIATLLAACSGGPAPEDIPGLLWPDPKPIQPFSLTTHQGRPFGVEALRDRWSFLFLGYTHCPDVCLPTMQVLKQVTGTLDERPGRHPVQVVFVSIDPQRDDSDALSSYIRFLDESFIGATGTAEQIAGLTRQIGISYRKQDGTAGTIDHTASVLLIDPQGRLISIFSPPLQSAAIADRFRMIRDFIEARP